MKPKKSYIELLFDLSVKYSLPVKGSPINATERLAKGDESVLSTKKNMSCFTFAQLVTLLLSTAALPVITLFTGYFRTTIREVKGRLKET